MFSKKTPPLENVASIILAGGQGSRLFPLTQTRCKPSVCFGGRYRLIDIPISNSLNAGIEQIFIVSQHLPDTLHQHVLKTYQCDFNSPAHIHLLNPKGRLEFKGTADAVRKTREHLEKTPVEYFLILSGDQLYNIDFLPVFSHSRAFEADLTILSTPVAEQDATRFGLLKTDGNNQVMDFIEKPTNPDVLKQYRLASYPDKPRYLASMGIYLFKKQALLDLLLRQGDDFGKELIPLFVKEGKVSTYIYKGYWEDIGTIHSYYKANMALLSQTDCLNTYDFINPIFTHLPNLPGPLIKQTRIHHSIIGQGSVIEAKEIKNSILGLNIHIQENTTIRNSILLGPPLRSAGKEQPRCVGSHCFIENAILDEGAQIGDGVELRNKKKRQTFDGNGVFIRDGIIIIPSGSQVPDGFIL